MTIIIFYIWVGLCVCVCCGSQLWTNRFFLLLSIHLFIIYADSLYNIDNKGKIDRDKRETKPNQTKPQQQQQQQNIFDEMISNEFTYKQQIK